jgi:RNA polymerase sigma-70 factor (ECF subfamily)
MLVTANVIPRQHRSHDVVPLRPELLREALRLTHRGPDAEDLVQETLLRAYRGSGTFRPGVNVRAWMHRIVKNTWISNYRATQRRLTEVAMEEFTGQPVILSADRAAPRLLK